MNITKNNKSKIFETHLELIFMTYSVRVKNLKLPLTPSFAFPPKDKLFPCFINLTFPRHLIHISESHFAPCLSVFLSQPLPLKNRPRSLAEPLDLSLGPNILLFPAIFQIAEPSFCHLQGHCRQSQLRLQIPYYDIPTCWSNLALPAHLLHTHSHQLPAPRIAVHLLRLPDMYSSYH